MGVRLFIVGANPPYDLSEARPWIACRDNNASG
jgi:hypothetical protein